MQQIKNINCLQIYQIKMFGRWVKINSRKEAIAWLRIRDKRLKTERRKDNG